MLSLLAPPLSPAPPPIIDQRDFGGRGAIHEKSKRRERENHDPRPRQKNKKKANARLILRSILQDQRKDKQHPGFTFHSEMFRKVQNPTFSLTPTSSTCLKRQVSLKLLRLHSSIVATNFNGISSTDDELKTSLPEGVKYEENISRHLRLNVKKLPRSCGTANGIKQTREKYVRNTAAKEPNIRKIHVLGDNDEFRVGGAGIQHTEEHCNDNKQNNFATFDQYVANGDIDEACTLLIETIERNQNQNDKYHQGLKWENFSCLIEALSRRKGRNNAKMATELLKRLIIHLDEGLLESKRSNLAPLYGNVLKLWYSCTVAPQRIKMKDVKNIVSVTETASEILEDMKRRKDTIATRHSYNLILSCYLRVTLAAQDAQKRGEDNDITLKIATTAAEKSEALFVEMVASSNENQRPNLTSYKAVLTSWSSVVSLGDWTATDRVLELLSTIEEYSNEPYLDARLYSVIFNALAQAAPLLEFNPRDSGAPANKAVSLLRRLVQTLKTEGPCPLDAMSYASIINAFAKSKVSENFGELAPANLASACLRQCHELHKIGYLREGPNDFCYGNAIAAWTRHLDIDQGCVKAEALLDQLEAHIGSELKVRSRQQRIAIWYNMVLSSFARSSFSPERGESILRRMEALAIADHRSYQAVLAHWGNLKCETMEDRSERALLCLRRMERPSIACYNTTLAACKATDLKHADSALAIAEQLFAEIPLPNAATYSRMISVYNSLLEDNPTRETKLEEIFQLCCKNGHVSILTLNLLSNGLSDARLKTLLGEHYNMVVDRNVDLHKLPEQWWKRKRSKKIS